MKVKLTALLAASLLVVACGKGGETAPKEQPVQPAGAAGAAGGAEAAKGAPAAEGAKPAAGAAASSGIKPPSTVGANTQVFITEFSDFQCPFCSRVGPTIEKIKETYGDKIGLSFMHNPLPFHKDAGPAAIAATAAGMQGKFFEMHDKLFANQRALQRADLEKYATELGLDMAKFKAALDDKAIADFVESNRAISNALGATGTPAFFINGKVLKGAQPFERFKAVIDEEITAAGDKKGDAWIKERVKANNADLAGYLWEGKKPSPVAKAEEARPRPVDRTVYKVTVDNKLDGIKGDVNAPVTLAIFSEFQCPFCKRVEPTFKEVEKAYGDKVRLVFKHNPLPFHKEAFGASEAALCAKDQGKFWEMHDMMFENQRAITRPDLDKYATDLGLDAGKFKSCMDSHTHKAQIEADQELAGKVTARGTPNTFVNGRKLTGAKPFAEFKDVIDEELKKAEALLAKGTSPENLYAELIKDGTVFEPLEAQVNTFDISKSAQKGNAKAKIQIVEFSDFQCPFCSRVTSPLDEVAKHYGDEAVVVFKHFPLNFHKEAMPAAIAAECASDQGKFWEMHDLLFANQKDLGAAKYPEWAKQVGLNEAKFKDCFDNQKTKDRVEADMAEARKAGVRGTPTLFINGRKFTSPSGYNLNAFTSVVDKYIKGKK